MRAVRETDRSVILEGLTDSRFSAIRLPIYLTMDLRIGVNFSVNTSQSLSEQKREGRTHCHDGRKQR